MQSRDSRLLGSVQTFPPRLKHRGNDTQEIVIATTLHKPCLGGDLENAGARAVLP